MEEVRIRNAGKALQFPRIVVSFNFTSLYIYVFFSVFTLLFAAIARALHSAVKCAWMLWTLCDTCFGTLVLPILYCVKNTCYWQSPTWWWVTAPTQYLRVENYWPQEHRAKAVLFLESESILVISKLDNAAESALSLESCPPASCTIMNPTQQFGMNQSSSLESPWLASIDWTIHSTFHLPLLVVRIRMMLLVTWNSSVLNCFGLIRFDSFTRCSTVTAWLHVRE